MRLSEMNVFSARPDLTPTALAMEISSFDSLIPSPLQRYHQILFPALRLCQALLASLGGRMNRSAASQILHFITSNEELVRTVLRSRPEAAGSTWSMAQLQETSLLTGIIARSVSYDIFEGTEATTTEMELAGHGTIIYLPTLPASLLRVLALCINLHYIED
jgi:nuclear pore complex protein Nup205